MKRCKFCGKRIWNIFTRVRMKQFRTLGDTVPDISYTHYHCRLYDLLVENLKLKTELKKLKNERLS